MQAGEGEAVKKFNALGRSILHTSGTDIVPLFMHKCLRRRRAPFVERIAQ